jgi:hypothetical protein
MMIKDLQKKLQEAMQHIQQMDGVIKSRQDVEEIRSHTKLLATRMDAEGEKEERRITQAQKQHDTETFALTAQNVDLSAGQLGAQPLAKGQQLNAVVKAKSRLQTPEQFRAIVVKTLTDGSIVRLSDVATVEMGQESYTVNGRMNAHPGAGIGIAEIAVVVVGLHHLR